MHKEFAFAFVCRLTVELLSNFFLALQGRLSISIITLVQARLSPWFFLGSVLISTFSAL